VPSVQPPHVGQHNLLRHKQILVAMTASIALLAGLSSAEAQFFGWPFSFQQPTVTRHRAPAVRRVAPQATNPVGETAREKSKESDKAAAKDRQASLAAKADGVLTIAISLNKQQLTLYSDGVAIARSKVSTGSQTPTGIFSIIQKERFHHSDAYDAPYMQRITKSGVAIYQAGGQGNPQGSIRLPDSFARQLWDVTRVGVRVIVTRGEITPATVSNPRLFARKVEPAESKPEPGSSAHRVDSAYSALGAGQKRAPAKARDAALDAYARANEREPKTSSEVVRSAYDNFDLSNARRHKSAPSAGSVAEVQPLRPGPISVFISRKEGKLFVRKGFEPVFTAPVTFQQPERPLGTHVFTALASNDDDSLHWNVVTVPTDWSRSSGKGRTDEPVSIGKPSTAADVLDRVTIPPEAINRISELVSEGASLIVSDQGLGPETGRGTDFVVLTR
jgi:lipoprotein-anchoring transpeptidase ErfK/SrfK